MGQLHQNHFSIRKINLKRAKLYLEKTVLKSISSNTAMTKNNILNDLRGRNATGLQVKIAAIPANLGWKFKRLSLYRSKGQKVFISRTRWQKTSSKLD